MPSCGATPHLLQRRFQVPERESHDGDEPLRVLRGKISEEVVVCLHAGHHGPRSTDLLDEHMAVEAEEVRVQHLRVDAVLIEALQSFSRIPRTRIRVRKNQGMRRGRFRPTGHRSEEPKSELQSLMRRSYAVLRKK